jgi:LysR family transcriptional regulator, chromosome initiation inhibitor
MLDPSQMLTVATIVREGSFERAARVLSLTPSALSQRVRALEERLGAVLIRRGNPCLPTPQGEALCRHIERVALLEAELRAAWQADGRDVAFDGAPPTLRVAVNADSLATWFVPALAVATRTTALQFDITLEDQDHTADLLRRGEVLAAVTGTASAVQGCRCEALGRLRYVATASPDFVKRHFPQGVTVDALAQAPTLSYSPKDELQQRFIRRITRRQIASPLHRLPSTHAFVDAARHGLGWGMNPEPLGAEALRTGELVPLRPDLPVDVPLYWQCTTLALRALHVLGQAVHEAAHARLLRDPD